MVYKCPFCVIVSNRRYNIKRHIYRKHPGKEIPQNLPSLFNSAALYSCPYCKTTSNRKYNMKEHINRKHHGAEIPENLGSTSKNFTHPSVLPEIPSSIYPTWPIYSNDIKIPPLQAVRDTPNTRKQASHKSYFRMFLELNEYNNSIQKPSSFPYFYQNKNIINFAQNVYESIPDIDFGEPFLFTIYKCSECFIDAPLMVNSFNGIRARNDYKHSSDCKSLSLSNEDNNTNNINLAIKKYAIEKIFEIIDHKHKNVKLKLFLKSINISLNALSQLKFEYNQIINNEKDNNNNNSNQNDIPSWLQRLSVREEFIDLENNAKNSWANRLIVSNNNSTEITKKELLHFIILSNATFGLFRFQKNHGSVYLFFTYLQLEKELN